jgi:hypothetical protein
MPDVPFFRGENRMDWLYAVMLQTAVDYFDLGYIQTVANILNPSVVHLVTMPSGLIPRCAVVVSDGYVFVVSASTKGFSQWLANVLGSAASSVPPAGGEVSLYFGNVALAQLTAVAPIVQASLPGRQLVLIGFSLGGASCEIMKDMFARRFSISSACVSFGNPRAGTTSFVAGYDSSNYAGFGMVNDPVPSVPPILWTSLGIYNGTVPLPPLVLYSHVTQGNTLTLDGSIQPGYSTMPLTDVLASLADGTAVKFHIQDVYARAIRTQGIPDSIPAAYQGYTNANQLDSIAGELFYWADVPWAWPHGGTILPPAPKGVVTMPCQFAIYIRDTGGVPAGFQETYYINNDDPSAVIDAMTASPTGTDPVSLRQAFLSNSCAIYAIRASFVGSPKKSRLIKFPTVKVGLLSNTDQIRTALAYFGYSPGYTVKRQFHFRGIPSNALNGDQLNTGVSAGQLTAGIDAFLAAMKLGSMVLRANNTTIASGTKIIGALKANQTDPITLLLGSVSPFANGDLVVVTGTKANPLLQGQWKVTNTTPNTSVILQGSANYSAPAALAGVIRPFTPTWPTLNTWQFNAVSSHDTGRPSFLPRGRQSARIRHR